MQGCNLNLGLRNSGRWTSWGVFGWSWWGLWESWAGLGMVLGRKRSRGLRGAINYVRNSWSVVPHVTVENMGASVITPAYPGRWKKGQNDGNPCAYSENPTSRRKFIGFHFFYRDFLYFPIACCIFLGFPINGHPHIINPSTHQSNDPLPRRPPDTLSDFKFFSFESSSKPFSTLFLNKSVDRSEKRSETEPEEIALKKDPRRAWELNIEKNPRARIRIQHENLTERSLLEAKVHRSREPACCNRKSCWNRMVP